ncbi:hypothetical protein A5752_02790 [Mycobacterium sp. 852002-51961_SCH5331710]|nr:hypothetical protein A5752_02790 [Mycobacterium sp. 852002-51961_SCH5331710]
MALGGDRRGAVRRRRSGVQGFAPRRRYQVYRDGAGEIVAPLDEVRFERRSRLLTSTLVVVTPSSTRIIMRGNVFSGGVGAIDRVLGAAVHGV